VVGVTKIKTNHQAKSNKNPGLKPAHIFLPPNGLIVFRDEALHAKESEVQYGIYHQPYHSILQPDISGNEPAGIASPAQIIKTNL